MYAADDIVSQTQPLSPNPSVVNSATGSRQRYHGRSFAQPRLALTSTKSSTASNARHNPGKGKRFDDETDEMAEFNDFDGDSESGLSAADSLDSSNDIGRRALSDEQVEEGDDEQLVEEADDDALAKQVGGVQARSVRTEVLGWTKLLSADSGRAFRPTPRPRSTTARRLATRTLRPRASATTHTPHLALHLVPTIPPLTPPSSRAKARPHSRACLHLALAPPSSIPPRPA